MDLTLGLIISAMSLLTGGVGGTVLKQYFERPKVRIHAFLVETRVPLVVFNVVNERKDDVHVTALMGKGPKKTRFLVATEPSKGFSFRMKGLEAETLQVAAHDAFPDSYPVADVTGFYLEDVTKPGRRWWVPQREIKRIKEGSRDYLQLRRDTVLWGLVCRKCGGTVYWWALKPRPKALGGYEYQMPDLPELAGWENAEFALPDTIGASACPGHAVHTVAGYPMLVGGSIRYAMNDISFAGGKWEQTEDGDLKIVSGPEVLDQRIQRGIERGAATDADNALRKALLGDGLKDYLEEITALRFDNTSVEVDYKPVGYPPRTVRVALRPPVNGDGSGPPRAAPMMDRGVQNTVGATPAQQRAVLAALKSGRPQKGGREA